MFEVFVELYRAIGSPPFEEGVRLSVRREVTTELQATIDKYRNSPNKIVEIDFDFDDEFVEIEFRVPSSEKGAIFHDEKDFVRKTSSLAKGDFRDRFYIVSLDYFSGDEEVPQEIIKIKRITDFVKSLREFVALSIDREQSMTGDRIFFLKPSDGKSPQKAAALKINLTADVIAHNLGGFKILDALKNALQEEKTQIEERILLMNTAIAQIIDECEDDDADFEYLVKNWGKVNKKYLHDLHAYVSAFSFDAVKKKISDGLIESSTKINSAIGEVGTKLLAVPASLAALIAVNSSSSASGFVFGIFGVIIASLIILRTIWHYENQINNLVRSFTFNMKEATKAKKTFSRSIQEEINEIYIFQIKQKKSIENSFRFYKFLTLLPIIASSYYIFEVFYPVLKHEYLVYRYCLS
ncbi:MAG: hypothetical protein LBE51_08825 [Acidovorax sp.]|jgi:hypothetical protein|nr:hypothetical protein [Acidovorax sp.]